MTTNRGPKEDPGRSNKNMGRSIGNQASKISEELPWLVGGWWGRGMGDEMKWRPTHRKMRMFGLLRNRLHHSAPFFLRGAIS